MSRVIQPSREELVELRERLRKRAGTSYEASQHDLEVDAWLIWEPFRSIDFLLVTGRQARSNTLSGCSPRPSRA